jgi:hypothetical protein
MAQAIILLFKKQKTEGRKKEEKGSSLSLSSIL